VRAMGTHHSDFKETKKSNYDENPHYQG